jgi:peroxiredoxin
MSRLTIPTIAAFLAVAMSGPAPAATTGAAAPQFTGTDANGRTVRLADYAGKIVVLEWTNHQCPYVVKHYRGNNMQALQKEAKAQGVVWLSIVSSAPGKEGHVSADQARELTTSRNAQPASVILDPTGTIGRAYSAKTSPHMFVIDAQQRIVYQGAIDDKPTAEPASLNGARNYVREALASVKAGKPVAEAETTPYGCSVKY